MKLLRHLSSRSDDERIVDVPGSSLLAIDRRRRAIGTELGTHVYGYAKSKFIVTSIMSVPGSIILEIGDPSILSFEASNSDLGECVCEHLLRHDAREPPNLRNSKRTNWPAFKVSGEKTVCSFEDKSSWVAVETANLFVTLEAAPVRSLHTEISIKGIAQPVHEELGATIRRTLLAVDAVRQAGII